MRILIVEDETLLALELGQLVSKLDPAIEIAGRTASIESTTEWLVNHPAPDLMLMDIELADGQCFEIFSQTSVRVPVIFTTAYDEYALQAFKVHSIDYLLKPIKEEELANALAKFKSLQLIDDASGTSGNIEKLLSHLQTIAPTASKERFLVKNGQKMISVNTSDIAFFYTKNKLSFLATRNNQKYMIDYSLDEIEAMIDPKQFFRANRQFIISHYSILSTQAWFNGKLKVEVQSKVENEVVVSRERAPFFKIWLGE